MRPAVESAHRPPPLPESTRYSRHRALIHLAFPGSENAVAEGVDEHIQLVVSRRFDAMEALLTAAMFGIGTLEKEIVVMNIEIQGGAKTLDQSN